MKLWNPELQEKAEADWAALYKDIEAAATRGVDPESPPAQALAQRHADLVGGFTGGHASIAEGLGKLWEDQSNWPEEFKRRMFESFAGQGVSAARGALPCLLTPEADAFFKKVMERRSQPK